MSMTARFPISESLVQHLRETTGEVAGVRMCDVSFREGPAIVCVGVRRVKVTCNLCHQSVGAVVVKPGIVRVNWHERKPIQKKEQHA